MAISNGLFTDRLGTGKIHQILNPKEKQVQNQNPDLNTIFGSNGDDYGSYSSVEGYDDVANEYMAYAEQVAYSDDSMVVGGKDYTNVLHTGIGETSEEVRKQIEYHVDLLQEKEQELADIQSGEDSAIKTLKEKAEELNQEYLDKVAESDEELAEEIKGLQDSKQEVTDDLNANEEKISEKQNSLSDTQSSLEASKQSKADLESQLSGAQGSITDEMTSEEKSNIQSQISQIQEAIASVESEIQEKEAQILKLEEEIAELEEKKQTLTEKNIEITEKLQEADQKAMELDESLAQMKEDIVKAEEDVRETQCALTQQVQDSIADIQEQIQALEEIAMQKEQEEAQKAQEEQQAQQSAQEPDVIRDANGNPVVYEAKKENAPEVLPQYQATVNELADERDDIQKQLDEISIFERLFSKDKRDQYERLEHKLLYTEFQIESYMPKG